MLEIKHHNWKLFFGGKIAASYYNVGWKISVTALLSMIS